MEKETITAKFKGCVAEKKRTVYSFENPNDADHDLKLSCFPPDLPSLVMGKTYRFSVEHIPTGDGKFYHNMGRRVRDGPYDVEEIKTAEIPPIPPIEPMDGALPVLRYKFEVLKHSQIRRESVLNAAIEYSSHLETSLNETQLVELARRFEKYVTEG